MLNQRVGSYLRGRVTKVRGAVGFAEVHPYPDIFIFDAKAVENQEGTSYVPVSRGDEIIFRVSLEGNQFRGENVSIYAPLSSSHSFQEYQKANSAPSTPVGRPVIAPSMRSVSSTSFFSASDPPPPLPHLQSTGRIYSHSQLQSLSHAPPARRLSLPNITASSSLSFPSVAGSSLSRFHPSLHPIPPTPASAPPPPLGPPPGFSARQQQQHEQPQQPGDGECDDSQSLFSVDLASFRQDPYYMKMKENTTATSWAPSPFISSSSSPSSSSSSTILGFASPSVSVNGHQWDDSLSKKAPSSENLTDTFSITEKLSASNPANSRLFTSYSAPNTPALKSRKVLLYHYENEREVSSSSSASNSPASSASNGFSPSPTQASSTLQTMETEGDSVSNDKSREELFDVIESILEACPSFSLDVSALESKCEEAMGTSLENAFGPEFRFCDFIESYPNSFRLLQLDNQKNNREFPTVQLVNPSPSAKQNVPSSAEAEYPSNSLINPDYRLPSIDPNKWYRGVVLPSSNLNECAIVKCDELEENVFVDATLYHIGGIDAESELAANLQQNNRRHHHRNHGEDDQKKVQISGNEEVMVRIDSHQNGTQRNLKDNSGALVYQATHIKKSMSPRHSRLSRSQEHDESTSLFHPSPSPSSSSTSSSTSRNSSNMAHSSSAAPSLSSPSSSTGFECNSSSSSPTSSSLLSSDNPPKAPFVKYAGREYCTSKVYVGEVESICQFHGFATSKDLPRKIFFAAQSLPHARTSQLSLGDTIQFVLAPEMGKTSRGETTFKAWTVRKYHSSSQSLSSSSHISSPSHANSTTAENGSDRSSGVIVDLDSRDDCGWIQSSGRKYKFLFSSLVERLNGPSKPSLSRQLKRGTKVSFSHSKSHSHDRAIQVMIADPSTAKSISAKSSPITSARNVSR